MGVVSLRCLRVLGPKRVLRMISLTLQALRDAEGLQPTCWTHTKAEAAGGIGFALVGH